MSVMDMRLAASIYHLVKEAQCGRHYEVGYGKRLCVCVEQTDKPGSSGMGQRP